jgi:hypothetical protein
LQSRIQNGTIVEFAEVSIELQDTLQPVTATGLEAYAGAVDKPTDIDMTIKLTRHTAMTQPELEQWAGSLPDVPNAEYRTHLRVRTPSGAGGQ